MFLMKGGLFENQRNLSFGDIKQGDKIASTLLVAERVRLFSRKAQLIRMPAWKTKRAKQTARSGITPWSWIKCLQKGDIIYIEGRGAQLPQHASDIHSYH